MHTTTFSRTRAVQAALIGGTFVLAFLLRYPSLFEPRWYGDEGIFAAIAANLRDGRMLYSGAWDNKPPLIYYTYAGVQSLFGTGVTPLHATATVVVLLAQGAVIAAAVVLFGFWRAALAGVAFAFLLGTPLIEGDLAMTETFMILPTSLAALAFVWSERGERVPSRAACVAIGVLIGIAAGYKQVAGFDGLAIAVMLWLLHARSDRDASVRSLAAIAAGFCVPQLALALLFLATGAFGAYWYAIVGSLGLYARLGPDENVIARLAGYLPAIIVITVVVRRRERGDAITMASFPVVWLTFALIGVTSSSFPFPHYLQQAVPPLALTIASLPRLPDRERPDRIALTVAAILVVAVVVGQFTPAYREREQLRPVRYYQSFVSHEWGTMSDLDYTYRFDGKVVAVNDISATIRADGAGGSVFTWSELPWIYADTGLPNPSRYYTSFLGDEIPGARDEILRTLNAQPPTYVVISDEAYAPFEQLDEFLAGRYDLLRSAGDWRVYRLSDATGSLQPQPPRPSAETRALIH